MGLDRAPIEFQTFYFFHVWLVPPITYDIISKTTASVSRLSSYLTRRSSIIELIHIGTAKGKMVTFISKSGQTKFTQGNRCQFQMTKHCSHSQEHSSSDQIC